MKLDKGTNELSIVFESIPVGLATIEGLVTDHQSNPLPNIRIALYEYATAVFIDETSTDSSGFYHLVNLQCKLYKVVCDAYSQGYVGQDAFCSATPGINTINFKLTPV